LCVHTCVHARVCVSPRWQCVCVCHLTNSDVPGCHCSPWFQLGQVFLRTKPCCVCEGWGGSFTYGNLSPDFPVSTETFLAWACECSPGLCTVTQPEFAQNTVSSTIWSKACGEERTSGEEKWERKRESVKKGLITEFQWKELQ
jgi:hypothetical protein